MQKGDPNILLIFILRQSDNFCGMTRQCGAKSGRLYLARRASEPAGRTPELGGRAPEPAGRASGDPGEGRVQGGERKK